MTASPITACLGVDQGLRSGWALVLVEGRKVVAHGVVTKAAERSIVVVDAIAQAEDAGGELLVAFEDHGAMPLSRLTRFDQDTRRRGRQGAPERSTRSILGQGKAHGRWLEQLDLSGHRESLRIEVEPRVWRRRIHGVVSGDVKGAALDWARRTVSAELVDHDEAEACALALYGAVDGVAVVERNRLVARLYARGRRNERRQLELGGER